MEVTETCLIPAKSSVDLTPQQDTFCFWYDKCHNATHSAIKAGYSLDSARSTACDLLKKPHIQIRLHEIQEARGEDPEVMSIKERERVLSEIGRAKINDFVTPDGSITSLDSRAIRSVSPGRYGTSLKLSDPIVAISELNKMQGVGRDLQPQAVSSRVLIVNVSNPDTKTLLAGVQSCLMPDDRRDTIETTSNKEIEGYSTHSPIQPSSTNDLASSAIVVSSSPIVAVATTSITRLSMESSGL